MQPFPHHYNALAQGAPEDTIIISSQGLPDWPTAAPTEFDGPGDLWSPETMLVAAAANCFILTFRAIAKASRFEWTNLSCAARGVLDRVERVTQFTEIELHVQLTLPADGDVAKAERLLEKAEQNCLITSSLKATVALRAEVVL
jgi:peroxiredoxin-like protein